MTEQQGILQYFILAMSRTRAEPVNGAVVCPFESMRASLLMTHFAAPIFSPQVFSIRASRWPVRTTSSLIINPGEPTEVALSGTAKVILNKGDQFQYVHASGGGYGKPFERDPVAVLDDVLDESKLRTTPQKNMVFA